MTSPLPPTPRVGGARPSFGRRFLAAPERFPPAEPREPWGAEELTVELPGGPYRLTGLSRLQVEAVRRRYLGWVGDSRDEASASVTTRLHRVAPDAFRKIDLRGWDYTLDLDAAPASLAVAGLSFAARLDLRPPLTGEIWTSDDGDGGLEQMLENYLRVLVSYRLLELGGALLHSSGVVVGRGAVLFIGPSGAGKTTIARRALDAGHSVLSDDINGLVPDGGSIRVARLPFAGDLGQTEGGRASFPLLGVFRLVKGSSLEIVPRRGAEMMASLIGCASFVNGDPHRLGQLARALERIVREVATGALVVPREAGFEEVRTCIEEVL